MRHLIDQINGANRRTTCKSWPDYIGRRQSQAYTETELGWALSLIVRTNFSFRRLAFWLLSLANRLMRLRLSAEHCPQNLVSSLIFGFLCHLIRQTSKDVHRNSSFCLCKNIFAFLQIVLKGHLRDR
jgi:hypothetical protein